MECQQCGGPLELMGVLGRRVYGRCRQCGSLESVPVCHECAGHGTIWDEAAGAYANCSECGGTGERSTTYAPAPAPTSPVAHQLTLPPM